MGHRSIPDISNAHRVMIAAPFSNLYLREKMYFQKNKKLGFTPSKDQQPFEGMALQEKKAQKRLKHTGNLSRKNLQLIGVF